MGRQTLSRGSAIRGRDHSRRAELCTLNSHRQATQARRRGQPPPAANRRVSVRAPAARTNCRRSAQSRNKRARTPPLSLLGRPHAQPHDARRTPRRRAPPRRRPPSESPYLHHHLDLFSRRTAPRRGARFPPVGHRTHPAAHGPPPVPLLAIGAALRLRTSIFSAVAGSHEAPAPARSSSGLSARSALVVNCSGAPSPPASPFVIGSGPNAPCGTTNQSLCLKLRLRLRKPRSPPCAGGRALGWYGFNNNETENSRSEPFGECVLLL